MTAQTPQPTKMQKVNKVTNDIYWLVIWVFFIIFGFVFDTLGYLPSWVKWVFILIGLVGLVAKIVNFSKKGSLSILVEAVANFIVAIACAIGYFTSLAGGVDNTWILGIFALVTIYLGVTGILKYRKTKAAPPTAASPS